MNPWRMIVADLRAMRGVAWTVIALIAIAVAMGVAVSALERAVRQSSARAADDFPLLIGAPASQTQLVLTAVYLQLDALTLVDGEVLRRLARDQRVRAFAPIAFGDVIHGYPVVGTTAAFATRWGRLTPADGRVFAAEGEAVIGADVALSIGASVTPSHMAHRWPNGPGQADANEAAHQHEHVAYRVVGRLPRLHSPWDRAILVPIESVWETHGLPTGHAEGVERLGPPFDGERLAGVPAIVVQPASIANAYALRAAYRQGGTMALFPAETLVTLYGAIGDARDIALVVSTLNAVLVVASATALLLAIVGLRRRRYAVLRALGAPPRYILAVVWGGAMLLAIAGTSLGIGLGWIGAEMLASLIAQRSALLASVAIAPSDAAIALSVCLIGATLALIPAIAATRGSIERDLR